MSGDDHLYALKEFDGSTNWSYDFSGLPFPSVNPAAVAGGIVYVAAGQQSSTYLFAFNAASGALVFKSAMSSQWENYLAPTIGASGIYTNAGTYGGLYGFTTSGHGTVLRQQEEQTSLWTPAVDAGSSIPIRDYLQVNDPVTRRAVTHTIPDPTFENYTYVIGGSPVIGAPGSVFMANYENSLLNGGSIGNTLLNFQVASNSIAWKIRHMRARRPTPRAGSMSPTTIPWQLEVRAETDRQYDLVLGSAAGGRRRLHQRGAVDGESGIREHEPRDLCGGFVHPCGGVERSLVGKLSLSKNGVLYIQAADGISAFNVD